MVNSLEINLSIGKIDMNGLICVDKSDIIFPTVLVTFRAYSLMIL